MTSSRTLALYPITPALQPAASPTEFDGALEAIRAALSRAGMSLADAIRARSLYFRASIIGNCNLSCPFCHNEGGPTKGKLSLRTLETASAAARQVGFCRLQLSGGEPLIHPDLPEFIRIGREHFADVGVTTNGSFLTRRMKDLVGTGLTRMHVSLQSETLRDANDGWTIPSWLEETISQCSEHAIHLRFNLPVAAEDIGRAESFLLRDVYGFDLNVFSILADGTVSDAERRAYLTSLSQLVDRARQYREGSGGAILFRSHIRPTGVRCGDCHARQRCTEQSRSLRLGVDGLLRPCLATRRWDFPFREAQASEDLEKAALLGIDFAEAAA